MRRFTINPDNKILKAICAVVFWAAIWQVAALTVNKELILPGPIKVAETLVRIGATLPFWEAAGRSLLRIFLGLVAGIVAGTVLAVLTSWNKIADMLISSVIRIVRATPVASFIILALLWLGKMRTPGFISMLMVVPIVWGNVCSGIAEIDRDLIEMAHMYRFSRGRMLKLLYIPAVQPSWSAACITAVGLAWKAGIAAEVLCLPSVSIGTNLYYSKIYLETPSLFAWTAVVVILSYIIEKGFVVIVKKATSRLRHGSPAKEKVTDYD